MDDAAWLGLLAVTAALSYLIGSIHTKRRLERDSLLWNSQQRGMRGQIGPL